MSTTSIPTQASAPKSSTSRFDLVAGLTFNARAAIERYQTRQATGGNAARVPSGRLS